MSAAPIFDIALCALIVGVALAAFLARDLLASIMFFIVYGLFAAIAWVRLDSVDVALAEAAIGAGLTGLLLVGAAARLKRDGSFLTADPPDNVLGLTLLLPAALCAAGAAAILAVVLTLGDGAPRPPPVSDRLDESGVGNPVTAVLLNFRAYDTLLEAVVLVVAIVAVWSLTPDRFWGGRPGLSQHARPDGVLAYFGRLLPAVGLMIGVHLLWAGADAPGGAFQAGTVLAAVWLLTAMAGLTEAPAVTHPRLRLLLIAGPAVFLAYAAAGAATGTFLAFPEGAAAKPVIVAIEVVLTVSIAAALCLLVLGVPRRAP